MIKRYFIFIILSLFIAACGTYDPDESAGTGSIAFSVDWQGAPTLASSGSELLRAASIDCTAAGVSTVEAKVYDSSNNLIASGGPWSCSAHSGSISNVPAGSGIRLVVRGKDSNGNILYSGTILDITVTGGQTTNAGTITMIYVGGANTWVTKAAMPFGRAGSATEAITGLLYVAGGNDGTSGTSTLQTYNPATNTWSTLAPMPGARHVSNGAGVINNQLYVAGGWVTALPANNLWVYDPASNTWSTKTSMPILSACGATGVINGKLYVATPCDGSSGIRNFLHVYDPATDTWTPLASSPSAHRNPAFGVIGGKFYLAGGWHVTGTTEVLSQALEAYDPATNTWSTLAPMPKALGSPSSGVINGKLYVVGGNSTGAVVNTTYVYDPVANSWTSAAIMPTPRDYAASGVIAGKLYVAGGRATNGAIITTVEEYTP